MSLKGGLTNGSTGARAARIVCLSETMNSKKIMAMEPKKRIALLAHDNKKQDLFEWAKFNRELLADHDLYATRTTGKVLEELDLKLVKLESGPLGGDQQIGAKICEGEIDFVIFFSDPLEPVPHDPDIRALLRIAMRMECTGSVQSGLRGFHDLFTVDERAISATRAGLLGYTAGLVVFLFFPAAISA
jgi:methylglyoxal synthase